tara:strand:- start:282 stop:413 length:132 start_codon:yes stop_codon:yes gene_type:complete
MHSKNNRKFFSAKMKSDIKNEIFDKVSNLGIKVAGITNKLEKI